MLMAATGHQTVCEEAVVRSESVVEATSFMLDLAVQATALTNDFWATTDLTARQAIHTQLVAIRDQPKPDLAQLTQNYERVKQQCLYPFANGYGPPRSIK